MSHAEAAGALKRKSEDAPETGAVKVLLKRRTLLTEADVTPALRGQYIDLYWPEPPLQGWWAARVMAFSARNHKAKLFYDHGEDEEPEEEEIDLMEVVRAGHVSFHAEGLPCRNGIGTGRKRKAASGVKRAAAAAAASSDDDEEAGDAEGEEGGCESESEGSDGGAVLVSGPRPRKPTARMRAFEEGDEGAVDAPRRSSGGGGGGARKAAHVAAPRAPPPPRPPPPPRVDHAALARAAEAEKEKAARERVASVLAEALTTAAAELAAEGATGVPPGAAASIATALEAAVYDAHKGLTKEYKTRIRSLGFNLKDPANPDLRARVLLGELAPARLAVMPPEELASQQLSAWRQAKAAEAVKAVTMRVDEDTDKLGRRLRKTHKGEEVVETGGEAEGGGGGGALSGEAPALPPLSTASLAADVAGGAGPEAHSPSGDTPRAPAFASDTPRTSIGTAFEAATGGTGGAMESFEAFASRQQADEEAAAAAAAASVAPMAKRTRIELPSNAVTVVAAAPPPPPAAVPAAAPAARAARAAAAAAAPAAPAAPRPARAPKPAAGPEWSGTVQSGTPPALVPLHARPVGGEQAPLGGGFLPSVLQVKGRTFLTEVDKYVSNIQRGKSSSRALTLALAAAPPGAGDADVAALGALGEAYAARGRAGLAQPAAGVEVYLVPPGELATRLLEREGLPALPGGSLLLVAVHRKGLGPAKPRRAPSPPDDVAPPAAPAPAQPLQSPDATLADASPKPPQPQQQQQPAPDIAAPMEHLANLLMGHAMGNVGALSALSASLSGNGAGGPPARAGSPDEDLPEFDFFGGGGARGAPPQGSVPMPSVPMPMMQMPVHMAMPPPYGAQMPPQQQHMMPLPPQPPPYAVPPPRPPPGPPPQQQQQWAVPPPAPPPGPPPSAWGAPGLQQAQQYGGMPPQQQMGIRPPMPPPGPPPGMAPWEQQQQAQGMNGMNGWGQALPPPPPPAPPPGPPPAQQRAWDPRTR